MRFSSRSTRYSWLVCAGLLMAVIDLSGCEDKGVGRVCDLNIIGAGGTDRSVAVIQPQALECPERICVRPAVDPTKSLPDTTSLCSAECSSNDDCSDGEKRGSDTGDLRCKSGFVCAVANYVGQMCCRKMCLCRDFVAIPDGGIQTPPACKASPENHAACPNVPSS